MTRPRAGVLVRVAVAAVLTAFVLYRSNPSAAGSALAATNLLYVAAAVALVFADRALMAFRWLVLLRPLAASRPPFRDILRVFFISTFVGTFLPASVGGDAVRAYALSRYGVRLASSVASVLLDRMVGIVAILLLGGVAAAVAPASVPSWLPPVTITAGAATCLVVAIALFSRIAERIARSALERLPWATGRRAGAALLEAVHVYRRYPEALLNVLAGSLGVQTLRIAQAWLLGLSLGIPLGLLTYCVYVPVILLIMQVPVTINGIGTSQWAFVALFGASGVSAADAFALSVLFVALGVVGNLPGGLLYATGGLVGETGDQDIRREAGDQAARRSGAKGS